MPQCEGETHLVDVGQDNICLLLDEVLENLLLPLELSRVPVQLQTSRVPQVVDTYRLSRLLRFVHLLP